MEFLSRLFGKSKAPGKKYESEIEAALMSLPVAKPGERWRGKSVSLVAVLDKYKKLKADDKFKPALRQSDLNHLVLGEKAVWRENLWTGENAESMSPITVQRVGRDEFIIDDASTYY